MIISFHEAGLDYEAFKKEIYSSFSIEGEVILELLMENNQVLTQ